jgi:hypothetical protein
MKSHLALALSLLATLPGVSRAAVITFGDLSGNHSDPFSTSYTEAGFTVTPITGRWLEGHDSHVIGNPLPDIYGDTFTASLEVNKFGGGLFAFTSVDLASGTLNAPVTYTIEGLLGGSTIFSASSTVPYPFVTVGSPSGAAIDTLRISMIRNQAEGYLLDNINVTPVLEPSSLAVFLGCLSLLGGWHWSRFRTSRTMVASTAV